MVVKHTDGGAENGFAVARYIPGKAETRSEIVFITRKTLRDVRVLRDAPALAWARRVEVGGMAALCLAAVFAAWAAMAWWRFG